MLVLVTTVLTPFLTDMFADVTPRTNPTAFFLLLPTLAFAVRAHAVAIAATVPGSAGVCAVAKAAVAVVCDGGGHSGGVLAAVCQRPLAAASCSSGWWVRFRYTR